MARPRTVEDDEVLAAVARAVARVGPLRMTLADVADQVGVTPSALVQRFGGKRQLLLAMVDQGSAVVDAGFARARALHPDAPLDALVEALAEGGSRVRTPQEVAASLAFLQLDLTDPDFHARTLAWFRRLRAGVRGLLEEARRAGSLRPEADSDALAHGLEVTYNGSLLTWAVHREGEVGDAVRRDLEALLRPWRAAAP